MNGFYGLNVSMLYCLIFRYDIELNELTHSNSSKEYNDLINQFLKELKTFFAIDHKWNTLYNNNSYHLKSYNGTTLFIAKVFKALRALLLGCVAILHSAE